MRDAALPTRLFVATEPISRLRNDPVTLTGDRRSMSPPPAPLRVVPGEQGARRPDRWSLAAAVGELTGGNAARRNPARGTAAPADDGKRTSPTGNAAGNVLVNG